MPNEPAAEGVGSSISSEVSEFNNIWKDRLIVLNTTISRLVEQLWAPSPEYAAPNWAVVKGQQGTLLALKEFAAQHDLTIYVRVLTWGQALPELRSALRENDPTDVEYPDVMQIGTTWRGALSADGSILAPNEEQRGGLEWKSIGQTQTVPYMQDIRLIWYWRRHLENTEDIEELQLIDETWETIIESLKKRLAIPRPRRSGEPVGRGWPPMAFPTLQLHLDMHDYAQLVWSGGGEFLVLGQQDEEPLIDLTSNNALKVPRLITNSVWQRDVEGRPYRLFAFPESSHSAAMNHFIAGEYTAIIEPVGFLPYLRKHFEDRCRLRVEAQLREENGGADLDPQQAQTAARQAAQQGRSMLQYIGVAIPPPRPFKGGSDLAVGLRTAQPDLAFRVARFLASPEDEIGEDYAREYAKILTDRGFLPPQLPNHGVDSLLGSLDLVEPTVPVRETLLRAISEGRMYPDRKDWADDIERRETLEAFQKIWRRMDQADSSAVEKAAREAEEEINYEINSVFRDTVDSRQPKVLEALAEAADLRTQRWAMGAICLAVLVTALTCIVIWSFRQRQRERGIAAERERLLHEKNEVFEAQKRARGFTSMALAQIDALHPEARRRLGLHDRADVDDATRAAIVLTGLRELSRGLASDALDHEPLDSIVWRSILHAIDSVKRPGIFASWDDANPRPEVEAFLREEGLLRRTSQPDDATKEYFHFEMEPRLSKMQSKDAFLLEQALACLLQNAIRFSEIKSEGYYRPVFVRLSGDDEPAIVVQNFNCTGDSMHDDLSAILTSSLPIREFEDRLRVFYQKNDPRFWPGIGLTQAYAIANQFFGGLTIEFDKDATRVGVRIQPKPRREQCGI